MNAKEIAELELTWLNHRTDQNFNIYWKELIILAKKNLIKVLSGKKIRLQKDKIDEISHDACTRLVEMYLKREKYELGTAIPGRIYNEIIFQLYNYKVQRYDAEKDYVNHELELSGSDKWDNYNLEALDGIFVDYPELRVKILKEAQRNCYFKKFLTNIAVFTPKQFVYDNFSKIQHIFAILKK